jgi:hypothetical protein
MYDPKKHLIPPNSPLFKVLLGVTCFIKIESGTWTAVETLLTWPDWRGIVCAVARSAWLDEAGRIHKEICAGKNTNLKAQFQAAVNAEMWAELAKEA